MSDFLIANYHTHTYRCKHAYDTEREYIEEAIRLGIKKLGFSDHIPCPFTDGYVSGIRMTMEEAAEYVDTIRNLGEEYRDDIKIYVGFEAEYIKEFYQKQMDMFNKLNCDYLIMGQHFTKSEKLGPYSGEQTTEKQRLTNYVDSVIEGMATGSYKYLVHPDLINYVGDNDIYSDEMSRLCNELKRMDIPLEINILGIGEKKHYPNPKFWEIAAKTGNKVILGLDAHCIRHMGDVSSYKKAMELVKKYNLNLIHELDI